MLTSALVTDCIISISPEPPLLFSILTPPLLSTYKKLEPFIKYVSLPS